ncbi:KDO transferase A [Perilla frutescens var. frutescens]|nr:KDO transferase A [Perilla frutescens var. frutescens]
MDKILLWYDCELRDYYSLTPIAVVGGSFLPGLAGHNISEAAAAGCAVLTGHHVGHFSHMVAEMQHVNPLSILQVSREKLVEAVNELFVDAKILEARREAARQAYSALSRGTVEKLWEMLYYHVFMKSEGIDDVHGARS